MTEFDPTQHRMVTEQRWFDDFKLGERFLLPSRTMTEAVFLAFSAASGDAPTKSRRLRGGTAPEGGGCFSTWACYAWAAAPRPARVPTG